MTTSPASPAAPDDLTLSPSAWNAVRTAAFAGRLTLLAGAFITLLAAWINRPLEGALVGVFVTLMALGLGALAGLSAFTGARRQLDAGAALLALLLAGGEAVQAFGLLGQSVGFGVKEFYVLPFFAWILLLAGGLALFATLIPGPVATATHTIPNPFAQTAGGPAPGGPTPGGFAPPQPQGPPQPRTDGFAPPQTTAPEPTYAPPADRPAPDERPPSLFRASEDRPAPAPGPREDPAPQVSSFARPAATDVPEAAPDVAVEEPAAPVPGPSGPSGSDEGPVAPVPPAAEPPAPSAPAEDGPPAPSGAPTPAAELQAEAPAPPAERPDEPAPALHDEPTAVSPAALPEDRPTETFTPPSSRETASFAPPVPREERRPTPPEPAAARAADPEPGWYPSPDGRTAQWWDGGRWSGERRPLSDFEDDGGRRDG